MKHTLNYSFTGHRGDKLTLNHSKQFGYDINSRENKYLQYLLYKEFIKCINSDLNNNHGIDEINLYVGGALGADQIAFEVALKLQHYFKQENIKFNILMCIPFEGYHTSWKSKISLYTYQRQRSLATKLIVVDAELDIHDAYVKYKYIKRNEYMVDRGTDRLFAIYDGVSDSGGTYKTINYAKSKEVPVNIISTKYLERFADNDNYRYTHFK